MVRGCKEFEIPARGFPVTNAAVNSPRPWRIPETIRGFGPNLRTRSRRPDRRDFMRQAGRSRSRERQLPPNLQRPPRRTASRRRRPAGRSRQGRGEAEPARARRQVDEERGGVAGPSGSCLANSGGKSARTEGVTCGVPREMRHLHDKTSLFEGSTMKIPERERRTCRS